MAQLALAAISRIIDDPEFATGLLDAEAANEPKARYLLAQPRPRQVRPAKTQRLITSSWPALTMVLS